MSPTMPPLSSISMSTRARTSRTLLRSSLFSSFMGRPFSNASGVRDDRPDSVSDRSSRRSARGVLCLGLGGREVVLHIYLMDVAAVRENEHRLILAPNDLHYL